MSFMTFVLTGGVLTPDIAFVSLTLFNIMRMPMTSTSFTLSFFQILYTNIPSFNSSFFFSFTHTDSSIRPG